MNCAKCGRTTHYKIQWHCNIEGKRGFVSTGRKYCPNKDEHLHYYCNCGYSWISNTFDMADRFIKHDEEEASYGPQ